MKRTPLKRSNPKRRAAKHLRNFDGGIDHDGWIRNRDCLLCVKEKRRQTEQTQAAHSRARGMGGAGGNWKCIVPLCRHHHAEQESIGNRGILAKYGIDLMAEAERLAVEHDAALAGAVEQGLVAF